MNNKLREELELDMIEINAYRELDCETFVFGGIEMRNDGEFNLGSEDAYYEIELECLEEALWLLKMEPEFCRSEKKQNKKNQKQKINRYKSKKITQKKLKKLSDITWWTASYDEESGFYRRYYISERKKYAKYCSRRKVRHRFDFALKGNGYRKCFDYWWEIF